MEVHKTNRSNSNDSSMHTHTHTLEKKPCKLYYGCFAVALFSFIFIVELHAEVMLYLKTLKE